MTTRTRRRIGDTAVVLSLLLGGIGCSAATPRQPQGSTATDPTPVELAKHLSFAYNRDVGDGQISQTLTITNDYGRPLVESAKIEALDQFGTVLKSFKVESIYGSERRNEVLMPGESLDILRFSGAHATDVYSVRLVGVRAQQVKIDLAPE